MTGDWETSGARIVISSEALNLPCRPINEGCVKAEICSTKASFTCSAYVILTGVQERSRATLSMTAARSAIKTPRHFPIFMRRTIPVEPIEPAEPLSQIIKGRHAPRATLKPFLPFSKYGRINENAPHILFPRRNQS